MGVIVLKPSIDSSGGHGVKCFIQRNEYWESEGEILSMEYLKGYGSDFVLQEAVVQHNDLALLNPTSVNTIRIGVYRSVNDEKAHCLNSIIRVGGKGMFVDNACSGGKYAKVDIVTGKIGDCLFDSIGRKYTEQNGVDYSSMHLFVPYWDRIKSKCEEIAENIPHHRLFAFDMTITNEGKPIVIEYNVSSFSYWLFMFTNQKPLGDYCDEIVDYCKSIIMMNK